jgi:malic enzyme
LAARYISEEAGITEEEARRNFYVVDADGLIGTRRAGLTKDQRRYIARGQEDKLDLLATVAEAKPHILVGCAGSGGLFTPEILAEVAKHHTEPLVMPLSSPARLAECTVEDAAEAMSGNLMFCSGNAVEDYVLNREKTIFGNHCDNSFVFPGLAMGAVLSGATRVTDEMLIAAAKRFSRLVTEYDARQGKLFPRVENIRGVTEDIIVEVGRAAIRNKVAAGGLRGLDWSAGTLKQDVKRLLWYPEYVQYIDATWTDSAH